MKFAPWKVAVFELKYRATNGRSPGAVSQRNSLKDTMSHKAPPLAVTNPSCSNNKSEMLER